MRDRHWNQFEPGAEETAWPEAVPPVDYEHLASVVRHDLGEPVRAILSYCRFIREQDGQQLSGQSRDDLEKIEQAGGAISRRVGGLLEYLRVAQGPFQPTAVATETLVGEALAALGPEISETDAQVQVGRLASVRGDPELLRLLFVHLIRNALQHGGKPGIDVRIACSVSGTVGRFEVADDGGGIAPDHQRRIFDLFRGVGAGSGGGGIGLAVVHQIVQRHGGELWLQSSLGDGCRFSFTLPRAP